MDVIRREGLSVETPCNCMGVCGKCTVQIRYQGSQEQSAVLACTHILQQSLEVTTSVTDVNMVSVENGRAIDTALNPALKRSPLPGLLPKDKTDPDAAVPFVNRVSHQTPDIAVLKTIAALEQKKHKAPLFGVYQEGRLLDVLTEDREHTLLGLAVDLGTTGVSLYLLDLETGETLGKSSFLNPQYAFGGDVLTRASYCMEDAGHVSKLQAIFIEKLNEHIDKLTGDAYRFADIRQVVLAGNTIMEHVFLGVEPSLLTRYPYRPIFDHMVETHLPGIHMHARGIVTVLPCISSFIGGDIVSGIVSSGFTAAEKNALFIDIGTNGEIVLKQAGKLYGTSTAAGPALEGMNISCGCRAVPGAIEGFSVMADGTLMPKTIGGAEPLGICGSGLIDLIAALLNTGRLKPTGNLISTKNLPIAPGISISQKDIRQIQLAKGAISAGIRMLLNEAGGSYDQLDEIYIAGSFGYHLSADSVKRIGMIDPAYQGKLRFVGNSSLEGARLALLNREILPVMADLSRQVKAVELSNRDDFQAIFVKELSF